MIDNNELKGKVFRLQAMIPSAMVFDKRYKDLLEEQRNYAGKEKLTDDELKRLSEINKQIDTFGYLFNCDALTLAFSGAFEEYAKFLCESPIVVTTSLGPCPTIEFTIDADSFL